MQQRDLSAFSILLRRHRVAAGLTQEELAERARISVRTISDVERGIARRPQSHTMRQLADALALEGESRQRFLDAARGPMDAAAEDVGENGASRIHPVAYEQAADGQSEQVLSVEAAGERKESGRDILAFPGSSVAGWPQRKGAGRTGISRFYLAMSAVAVVAVLAAAALVTRTLTSTSTFTPAIISTAARPAVLGAWGNAWGNAPAFGHEIVELAAGRDGSGYILSYGPVTTALRFSASGQQLSTWTVPGHTNGQGIGIGDIQVDSHDNLWVPTPDGRIREFSPDGRVLATLGGQGFNPGQLSYPFGLTIAGNGDLVVGETGSHRIQVLTPRGRPIRHWEGPGRSPQNFFPAAMAVDAQDDIYVFDTGNRQIEKYSLQGKLLAIWHPRAVRELRRLGLTQGYFNWDVTTDPDGHVYAMFSVSRDHSLIIDKLSSSGKELATWTAIGRNPAVSSHVFSLRFTDRGYAYAFVWPGRVLKIGENGRALASWSDTRLRRPLFRSPEDIAVDGSGGVWVTDTATRRVVRLSTASGQVKRWKAPITRLPGVPIPFGIALGPNKNVLVADPGFGRVYVYSSDGKLLDHWVVHQNAFSTLVSPTAFGVDGNGRVSLLTLSGYTVSIYTPSGRLIRSWCAGCNMPEVTWPTGMTVGRAGDVYAAFPGEIVEFSPTGLPLRSWGDEELQGKGHFSSVSGLAVDGRGNLYVADTGGNTLQVFSPSGRVLAYWHGLGPHGARFNVPGAVAVDGQGDIYLIDGTGVLELAPLAT